MDQFEDSPGYTGRPCLKRKQKKERLSVLSSDPTITFLLHYSVFYVDLQSCSADNGPNASVTLVAVIICQVLCQGI